jgi:hypothetical protein
MSSMVAKSEIAMRWPTLIHWIGSKGWCLRLSQ